LTELFYQETDEVKRRVEACRTDGFPDSDSDDEGMDSDAESDEGEIDPEEKDR
jgi:hypothetical protein